MSEKSGSGENKRAAHQVTRPRFITDDEIGLGDVVKRATTTFGIRPCGGCERRAAALNRWLTFSGRRSR